jgi:hypothetical protein
VDEAQRPEIEDLWQRIALLLSDTRALLPGDADTDWYTDVMQTEQFELALEELIRLGDEHRPPPGYWNNLTAVASLIGQPDRIAALRARADAR